MSSTEPRGLATAGRGGAWAATASPEAWLALVAWAVYVPPAARVVQLGPDAVEYVDIARRLLAGEGFLLGVKAYHVGGTDILHDGLAERAPLYPLLAALVLAGGAGLPGLQVVNAALAGISAALVCAIGRSLFGQQVGILAGILAIASPVVLVRMVPPMTEALHSSLTLLATWLVLRFSCPPRPAAMLAAGVALGLGYLARPTTALLALALLAGLIVVAGRRHDLRRPLAAFAGGLLALVTPISLYSLLTRGSPSYSGQSYLYAVFKDSDVLRNGYRGPLPTAGEFIAANFPFVVGAIAENAAAYAQMLVLDVDWLLLLAPAWPLALLALARGQYPRVAWPALLVAAANFATYAATWSNYQERYQLLTLLLLLPFAVDGLGRLGLGRLRLGKSHLTGLHLAVLVVAAFWSATLVRQYQGQFSYGGQPVGARTDRGVRWTGPPRWVGDNDLARLLDWIDGRTAPREGLAHGQPWPLTFFTGRPATLLPIRLTEEQLRAFIVDYRVGYVAIDTRDRDRRGYQTQLEALSAAGVRASAVGAYRVFDTRSLWR